jgi:hypothetical protein
MGGMLAYVGIAGSRIGEGGDWVPWYFTTMVLTWAAVFFYATWRLVLDFRLQSSSRKILEHKDRSTSLN